MGYDGEGIQFGLIRRKSRPTSRRSTRICSAAVRSDVECGCRPRTGNTAEFHFAGRPENTAGTGDAPWREAMTDTTDRRYRKRAVLRDERAKVHHGFHRRRVIKPTRWRGGIPHPVAEALTDEKVLRRGDAARRSRKHRRRNHSQITPNRSKMVLRGERTLAVTATMRLVRNGRIGKFRSSVRLPIRERTGGVIGGFLVMHDVSRERQYVASYLPGESRRP